VRPSQEEGVGKKLGGHFKKKGRHEANHAQATDTDAKERKQQVLGGLKKEVAGNGEYIRAKSDRWGNPIGQKFL